MQREQIQGFFGGAQWPVKDPRVGKDTVTDSESANQQQKNANKKIPPNPLNQKINILQEMKGWLLLLHT